ncbi:hypothetical protein DH2020_023981 [Rehmannia glutinosa]|uniref:LIM zinc-binding domain-containing protein n=1 Tax=Rehmannia glutinosa TaxID=99300 RepID=A0ABR0W7J1_REHGL
MHKTLPSASWSPPKGTTQKCTACSGTVYLVDRLAADNRIYHKACFRCHHCKGTLKETSTLSRGFCTAGLIMISSSRELAVSIKVLKVTVNGTPYHKSCFKCSHGGCTISPSNYIAHEGTLYCKHHHIQLVKAKGNYSQLETDSEKDPIPPTSVQIAAES